MAHPPHPFCCVDKIPEQQVPLWTVGKSCLLQHDNYRTRIQNQIGWDLNPSLTCYSVLPWAICITSQNLSLQICQQG